MYLRPTEERKKGAAAPEPVEVTEVAEVAETVAEAEAAPKPRARTRRPPAAPKE